MSLRQGFARHMVAVPSAKNLVVALGLSEGAIRGMQRGRMQYAPTRCGSVQVTGSRCASAWECAVISSVRAATDALLCVGAYCIRPQRIRAANRCVQASRAICEHVPFVVTTSPARL